MICLSIQGSPPPPIPLSEDSPLCIAYQCCPPSDCRRLRFSITADFVRLTNYYIIIIIIIIIIYFIFYNYYYYYYTLLSANVIYHGLQNSADRSWTMKDNYTDVVFLTVTLLAGVPLDFVRSRLRSLRGRPRPSFFFGTSSGAVIFCREPADCSWLAGLSVTILSTQKLKSQKLSTSNLIHTRLQLPAFLFTWVQHNTVQNL